MGEVILPMYPMPVFKWEPGHYRSRARSSQLAALRRSRLSAATARARRSRLSRCDCPAGRTLAALSIRRPRAGRRDLPVPPFPRG